jgi:hypothetical protein
MKKENKRGARGERVGGGGGRKKYHFRFFNAGE